MNQAGFLASVGSGVEGDTLDFEYPVFLGR
jgi:hypothetical protein